MNLISGLIITSLSFALLGAQEAPASEEDALMALLNTPVSTASKHAERTLEAPGVVSLAVRDQIDSYGWNSLNDLLYTLPGFSASQDYDRSTVSSRGTFEGWNNNHLLIQVDGIPFNDNLYGSALTWEITPIFIANSVEVVRGPGSALYGSNAMNGVIQMKTLSAKDLPNQGLAQVRVGQDGQRITDFALGHQGSLMSAVVGFDTSQSRGNSYMGYDGSDRTNGAGQLQQFYVNDARHSNYAWAKLEGEGDLQGLRLAYHLQNWSYGTGHGWLWQTPDQGESMNEQRQIIALSYQHESASGWSQDVLVRHQEHDINWNMRFYPAAPTSFYPNGVNEYLNTQGSDDFLRVQGSRALSDGASLLVGFEGDRFLYTGDHSHYSNINLVTFNPNPGNEQTPAGPWLAWIQDQPMISTGFYAQFDSGKMMGDHLKAVLGLRDDKLSFNYNNLDGNENPTGTQTTKSFSDTSPRVAVVIMPSHDLSFKLMGGRAFRAPAPAELAGANTLTLGSNIAGLQPETLTTYEAAMDWIINPRLNWRTNVFWTKFNNEIAYSASANNLSTNVYTLTTEGLESELLFGQASSIGFWRGYVNVSYAKRRNETILDTTIAPSQDVTWVPSQLFKAGAILTSAPWTWGLNASYSGRVLRRASDVGSQGLPLEGAVLDMDNYRSNSVSPYLLVNTKLTYELSRLLSVSLAATNLLNRTYALDKTLGFPFDYQGQGRVLALILKASF